MSWRQARSLVGLTDETNAAAPRRSMISDGAIGDPAHRQRISDHNPDKHHVVAAKDLTHDPAHIADMAKLAKFLVAKPHPALKYVIFHGQIASRTSDWKWKRYTGTNSHRLHMHVSVGPAGVYDNTAPWGAALAWRPPALLRAGSRHVDVRFLQRLLRVPVTGVVDNPTLAAVKRYQTSYRLQVDGVVGPKTWGQLL